MTEPQRRPPVLTLIVAVSDDGFIGKEGGLPWRMPGDLARFKARTLGHTLIMGRKTFASVGRALPGRRTIVVSRGRPELPPGVLLAGSLDEALALAGEDEEVFVAGGQALYEAALERADRLDVTRIHTTVPGGDARFPLVDPAAWERVEVETLPADDRNPHARTLERWERASARLGSTR